MCAALRLNLEAKWQVSLVSDNSKAPFPGNEAKVVIPVLELSQENTSGIQLQLPITHSTPTLSPVKQCKGRLTLLRPLYERKYR